jgi:hypothetical protein
MTDFSLNLGLTHTSGHDLPVISAPDRTPEGMVHSETCRPIYSISSALAGFLYGSIQWLLWGEVVLPGAHGKRGFNSIPIKASCRDRRHLSVLELLQ